MTETWARILTHEASEYEESLARQGSRGTWDFPDDLMAAYAKRAKDLRRLASLLEQITPEMAEACSGALYTLHGPKMDGPRNATERGLLFAADVLSALSSPPSADV